MLVVNEQVEGDDEDEVSLARQRRRHSTQAVLARIRKVARTVNLTYVLSGTPSLVEVTTSKVRSKTGK